MLIHYRLHGFTVTSDIALPEVRRTASGGGGVVVERARAPEHEPLDWFHSWRLRPTSRGRRSRPWLSFARRDAGYVLRFPGLADFEVSAAADRVEYRPTMGLPRRTLRYLLLDQVLPLVLSQSGQLVLHGSAVHLNRFGSVAFVGSAGSGKSSLAGALGVQGGFVASDDCVVVTDIDRAPTVVPGYPSLRLWSDAAQALGLARDHRSHVAHRTVKTRVSSKAVRFRVRPSPLKAIFVLGRRRTGGGLPRLQSLTPRDRLIALAPYVYLMDVEDRDQLSRMFRQLATLATRVPVHRLQVTDDRRALLQTADRVLDLMRAQVS